MEIEATFLEICIIHGKKQFNKNTNEDSTYSTERLNKLIIKSTKKHMLEQINYNSLIIDFFYQNNVRRINQDKLL